MNISFYDNREVGADEQGVVLIDRVYCLQFHAFEERTWEQLGEIYRSLPQHIVKEGSVPMWYGEEGVSNEFLYTSVEPSGLQVVGELSIAHWEAWERLFHEGLSKYDFPSFEC